MDTVHIQKRKIPEHLLKYFKLKKQNRWILRNTIIWDKPNHMPSSVKDRFANSYEPVFMLVKNKRYFFDLDAVRVAHTESGKERAKYKHSDCKSSSGKSSWVQTKDNPDRKLLDLNPSSKNPGDVWTIPTQPFPDAHFATFPEKLVIPMIMSSCPKEICKKCGKARVRIIKKEYVGASIKRGGHIVGDGSGSQGNVYNVPREKAKQEFIGFTDCGCNSGWEAGIVLDPFMGSGTVAVVAKKLKRNYIGIEIKPEYVEMATKRINAVNPPLF